MYSDIIYNDMKEIYDFIQDKEKLKNKSFLITGATGMLGSYITNFLVYLNKEYDFNIKIYAFARDKKKLDKFFGDNVIKCEFDILKPIQIKEDIDYIFNTASPAGPNDFKNNPVGVIDAIVIGTRNLYEFARKTNTKKVFLISSIQAYGNLSDDIKEITEDMCGYIRGEEISSCYSEAKKLSEVMAYAYQRQYNVSTHLIRLTHAYGPFMNINDGRMIADFIRDGVNKRDIVLKSDGLAVRNLIYVSDVIKALFLILLKGGDVEYNITNDECIVRIRDIAKTITDISKVGKLVFYNDVDKNKDAGFSNIKIKKLSSKRLKALGFIATVNLEEGIRRTLESFWN